MVNLSTECIKLAFIPGRKLKYFGHGKYKIKKFRSYVILVFSL